MDRRESLAHKIQTIVKKVAAPTSPKSVAEREPKGEYTLDAKAYQIETLIGYGASATVYSAIYNNERVAIKMIDLDSTVSQVEEIRKELQIMSLCRHKNLLQVYGAFVCQNKLWIVTRYLSGGSALSLLKSKFHNGLDEGAIAVILKDCLQGLDYLHKNGHIHRDVKAGNLLIDSDGTVLLADFGVSSQNDSRKERKTFVGTPCWIAPEVLTEKGYNSKADIWSFGITAIELATGSAPYSKFPPMKVLLLILKSKPPTLPSSFSRNFRDMIEHYCLCKDPGKRWTAEKLLSLDFFKNVKRDKLVKIMKDVGEIRLRSTPTNPHIQENSGSHGSKVISWDFSELKGIEESNQELLEVPHENEENKCLNLQSQENSRNKPPEVVDDGKKREIRRGRFSVNLRPEEALSVVSSVSSPTLSPKSTPNTLNRRGRFEIQQQEEAAAKIEPKASDESVEKQVLTKSQELANTLKRSLDRKRKDNMVMLEQDVVKDMVEKVEKLEKLAKKLLEEKEVTTIDRGVGVELRDKNEKGASDEK